MSNRVSARTFEILEGEGLRNVVMHCQYPRNDDDGDDDADYVDDDDDDDGCSATTLLMAPLSF